MNMMNQDINLSDALPEDETSRQYYYIEKARLYVQELSKYNRSMKKLQGILEENNENFC